MTSSEKSRRLRGVARQEDTHEAGQGMESPSLIKDSANAVARYLYIGGGRVSERKYIKAPDGSTEVRTARKRGTADKRG